MHTRFYIFKNMHQKSYNVNLKIIIRYLQAIIKYWKLHAIMKHKTFFNCKKKPFSKIHAVHTKRAIITYKSFVHLAFNNSIQLKWLEYKFTLNTFFSPKFQCYLCLGVFKLFNMFKLFNTCSQYKPSNSFKKQCII